MTDFLDKNKGRKLIRYSTSYSAVICPKEIKIENLGEENPDDYVDENGTRYINTENLSAKEVLELLKNNPDDLYFDWFNTPTEFSEEQDINIGIEPEKSVRQYLDDSLKDF